MICVCLLSAQKLPLQYYLHFFMPIILWWYALPSPNVYSKALRLLRRSQKVNVIWIEVLCYGLGSIAMVRRRLVIFWLCK